MKTVRGKKALVTGAASGIGREIAKELSRQGAILGLCDVVEKKLDLLAAELRANGGQVLALKCDLLQPDEISQAVQRIMHIWNGELQILVNNAGVAHYGATHRMKPEDWQRVLGVNLLAPVQFIQELLPVMLAQEEAHVVNVASMFGLVASGRLAAYQTSKFGLVGLSESLRDEYARTSLGVSVLCPGFVETQLYSSGTCDKPDRTFPKPPRWLTTTPEWVAYRALQAILHNHGTVVITPAARVLWYVKRFCPGLLSWLRNLSRKRKTRRTHLAEKSPFVLNSPARRAKVSYPQLVAMCED